MPPRKRAESAPKTEEPDEQADTGTPTEPDTPDPAPERSDLQTVDPPCLGCFPGGWAVQADIVGALGCEHGTWQREAAG